MGSGLNPFLISWFIIKLLKVLFEKSYQFLEAIFSPFIVSFARKTSLIFLKVKYI